MNKKLSKMEIIIAENIEDDAKKNISSKESSIVPPEPPAVPSTSPSVKPNPERRGRPKTKAVSKLASFHLTLELIDKIDAASKSARWSKSVLVETALEEYFAKKK